ncbi:SGNH/GDSL hydrolase family protein [Cryobacterium sp. 10C3]|uniref:SGNH/GDSL hydrolase family protein n=1 Tax=Cryobacterium sp. 10C3 TaxID=3048577 RepID=UPI002AB4A5C5|nr:SGNH/GDSL hydrolase family protein [Cryobacterium sp. 10C3]MDY7558510.1 SGNH/GDSL hydrolase family protein [Cryobacterium sp. 10C3]
MYQRFIAMGDSFTEGVGDELPDGRLRGWADLVALGLAAASAAPVSYANLAVRGRLLGPIVAEQLEPALVQAPDLLSICGGGNDMMRPRVEISRVVGLMSEVVEAGLAHGAHMLVLSGGNPSKQLPSVRSCSAAATSSPTPPARHSPGPASRSSRTGRMPGSPTPGTGRRTSCT